MLDTGLPVPLVYIPFDPNSTAYDIVDAVSARLLELMLRIRNGTRFTMDDLLKPTILAWDSLLSYEKQAYRGRLHKLLFKHIPASGLHQVLKFSASERVWMYDPSPLGSLKKAKWISVLTELADKFVDRFGKEPVQLPLGTDDD
jgi:hypothetical protein